MIRLRNEDVKTFVRPCFNNEEFDNDERVSDLSFETLVDRGYSETESKEIERITIRNFPKRVAVAVFYLNKKHRNIQTLSRVQCFATMLGVNIIQANSIIKKIEHSRKMGIESGRIEDILNHFPDYYFEWGTSFRGFTIPKVTISVFKWVSGCLTDLGSILGIAKSTVALISLVIGLSESKKWLTKGLRNPLLDEVANFDKWLKNRADKS
jgi:hypothetical protein